MANQKQAAAIKQQYEQQWLGLKEVAAIGIGRVDNEVGIIISVTENPVKVREKIPARIEGVPIKIQQTGEFDVQ